MNELLKVVQIMSSFQWSIGASPKVHLYEQRKSRWRVNKPQWPAVITLDSFFYSCVGFRFY